MESIRRYRGVPAKRGMRVRNTDKNRLGVIRSAACGYLQIQLDGDTFTQSYHPTWKLEYLDKLGSVIWPKAKEAISEVPS